MNQQQMNMAMTAAGGPVGGTPLMNTGSRSGANPPIPRLEMLNTYIYDYFIRNECWDVARAMHKASKSGEGAMPLILGDGKSSPSGRDVNGVGDAMDTDNKDFKRPSDLPEPGNQVGSRETCFLSDWWIQFWDMFDGARNLKRGGGDGSLSQFISATQNTQRMRQERQNSMMQSDPQRMQMMYQRSMQQQNGMPLEMQKNMMNRANMTPQQQMMANKMMVQQRMGMQRDGQGVNMAEQRSQSPSGPDNNAPSPKRQRMEGTFNGQMGPAGRGQGIPGQPGPNMQAPGAPQMLLQNGVSLPEQMTLQGKAQFEGMNAGAQGSPMAQGGDGGNHALQDYQMQLMLLEQQNKKRLLMARQEQDNMSGHPGTNAALQAGQNFPTAAMSPGNRPGGPSPNPADMAKRGTPKMGNMPNPNSPADPNLQGNRGSPAPNFDPQQMVQGNMQQQFFAAAQMGTQMRPPSSHPGQPMNAQQVADFAARNQGRLPNGQMMPQGAMMQNPPQPGQMGQQPGQQPPMGTPRQATNMAPPPVPAAGEQGRTNTSSPGQPTAQPPTPSQTNKNLPNKAGKKDKAPPKNKGGANKAKNQSNTGATPASEAEPPTPTPPTPVTPMHANSFTQKNGTQPVPGTAVPGAQQPTPVGSAQAPPGPTTQVMDQPFGDLGGDTFGTLDLANFDSGDVLENFDFDSFLHTDDGNGAFGFDGIGFPDSTEVGVDG